MGTYTLCFLTTRTPFVTSACVLTKLLSELPRTWVVGVAFHPVKFLRVGTILQRMLQHEEQESRLRSAHFAKQGVQSNGLLTAVPFLEPGSHYLGSITESRRPHC